MEKNIVTSGKTIDLAIEAALQTLGLDRDSVSVQVLQQAKPGGVTLTAECNGCTKNVQVYLLEAAK